MNKLKVLMFGWEFPPMMSGGLGVACEGIAKGLSRNNVDVTFVMPQGPPEMHSAYARIIVASRLSKNKIKNVKIKTIPSLLRPYISSDQYSESYSQYLEKSGIIGDNSKPLYGRNIYEEVYRFAQLAAVIAANEDFDIIHCHDWMTYQAGIEAKKVSGKPLVVHIHNTVFDRGGDNGNPYEYAIEKNGFDQADKIFAISNFIKNKLISKYGIDERKIVVVYNGIDEAMPARYDVPKHDKIVLFLGRVTLQKGPDYFLEAAKKVLEYDPNVKFIINGEGDMKPRLVQRVAELGIGKNVLFEFVMGPPYTDRLYQMADLFVMPSVSEPFGLVPLEAIKNGTPVIISKQSGVSEVLKTALKVDFWDIDELASKIIAMLNYKSLHSEMRNQGAIEISNFNWDISAEKCISVYRELIHA
jgi:glycosyltransferase involved in cell wall biosynthesis